MSIQEQEQFKQLYLRYRPGLIAFAIGFVKNAEQAEEVVNDVFMGLWKQRETLEYTDELKSYLFTGVKNRCFNSLRKTKQLAETSIEDWDAPVQIADAEQRLQVMQLEQQIQFVINQLPPKCKQIFLLSRKEEMSYKQIAELMELSVKTVENQIGNALKVLKTYIKR